MNNIFSILNTCIYIVFPILIYLIIINYINKKNIYYLDISLLISLIFLIIYQPINNIYILLFYNIPLIISYIYKRKYLIIIQTLILIIYFIYKLNISIYLLLLINLIYYLLYKLTQSKEKFYQNIINIILSSQIFIISIYIFSTKINIYILINHLINILISILITYFIIKILTDSKYKANEISLVKELEKEHNLRTSISKLTHELKNPLSVCNGYLDMIDIKDISKTKKYFSIIKDEVKRSLLIINDFSMFSKLKNIEKEEIDLYLLLEEIYSTLNPLYIKNNAYIKMPKERELYIEADYHKLKQVFINILKNSLESKDKEKLYVDIKLRKIKNNIKITITDNGCGITKEELRHIEENFYTTKTNGSGLGIPYCKEIINYHNGKIQYKSIKNKGTIVSIILPI